MGGYACPSIIIFDDTKLVPVIGLASVVLGLKASAVVFTIVWIRATLPRLTFLSVIVGCWTWLLPLAIACLLFAPSVLIACDAIV